MTITVTRARIFEAVAASPMTTIHVADLPAAALTQRGVRLLQTGCGLGAAPGKAASVRLWAQAMVGVPGPPRPTP
jgi:hypothetical protein